MPNHIHLLLWVKENKNSIENGQSRTPVPTRNLQLPYGKSPLRCPHLIRESGSTLGWSRFLRWVAGSAYALAVTFRVWISKAPKGRDTVLPSQARASMVFSLISHSSTFSTSKPKVMEASVAELLHSKKRKT